MRMSGTRFAGELKKNGGLKHQLDRCVYLSMMTAMQIAACNQSHVLAQRLARWLLMVRDRVGRNEFRLTQEFLARMLGVRRAGVTDAAGSLQRRGLIAYRRGRIKILNLEGVRAASCEWMIERRAGYRTADERWHDHRAISNDSARRRHGTRRRHR